MQKLLLVEDMRFFKSLVQKHVQRSLNVEVVTCATYDEAIDALNAGYKDYFLAVLDLNLPDAPDGEIVDLVIGYNIPVVVFSSQFNEDLRDQILSKNVIDYVIKENPSSLDYLVSLVGRIHANRNIKTLVVDDSTTARKYLMDLMNRFQFQVLEASDGVKALEVLGEHPDIQLVITDYNMPNMDGFTLTREIRRKYPKHKIGIIGLSTTGSNVLSAKFIKNGANDFLNKPFLREEFFCRVSQNVELIEYMDNLKTAATHDFLTGLHNIRFLKDIGDHYVARSQREGTPMAVGVIDVDNFTAINEKYGLPAGDELLIQLGELLNERCRRADILARVGEEEFCIIANNLPNDQTHAFFDLLRVMIQEHPFILNDEMVYITASFGVVNYPDTSFETTFKRAEEALGVAKRAGRNKVIVVD